MPLFNFVNSSDDNRFEMPSCFFVAAVAMFPTNEVKRKIFMDVLAATAGYRTLNEPALLRETFKASTVQWAFRGKEAFQELFDEATRPAAWSPRKLEDPDSVHGGIIASDLLMIPLIVSHRSGKRIGRRAASRALSTYLTQNRQLLGAGERNLSKIWKHYASVAHLWTATQLRDGFPEDDEATIEFVSLAERIRSLGEAYRPARASEALLDSRITWKAPEGFPLRDIDLDLSTLDMVEECLSLAVEHAAD